MPNSQFISQTFISITKSATDELLGPNSVPLLSDSPSSTCASLDPETPSFNPFLGFKFNEKEYCRDSKLWGAISHSRSSSYTTTRTETLPDPGLNPCSIGSKLKLYKDDQFNWRIITTDKSQPKFMINFKRGITETYLVSSTSPVCEIYFAGVLVSEYIVNLSTSTYKRISLSFPSTYESSYRIQTVFHDNTYHRYSWKPLTSRLWNLTLKGSAVIVAEFTRKPFQTKFGTLKWLVPLSDPDQVLFTSTLIFCLNSTL